MDWTAKDQVDSDQPMQHPRIARARIPPGAWDTHCHTFNPARFPYDPHGTHPPPPASVDELLAAVPCDNFCIVMAMIEGVCPDQALYGASLVSQSAGPSRRKRAGRATLVLDIDRTTDAELQRLTALGARSYRIHAAGPIAKRLGAGQLDHFIPRLAHRLAPVKWSIDAQLPKETWVAIEPVMREMHQRYGTFFVADHCFKFGSADVHTHAWNVCLRMVQDGLLYVKISGWERIVGDDLEAMRPVVVPLASAHKGERCLFGSDWPHIQFEPENVCTLKLVDSSHELEYLRQWLGLEQFEKLLVHNPQRLYGW